MVCANLGPLSGKIACRKPGAGLAFFAVFARVLWLTERFCHACIQVFAGQMQLACTDQKLCCLCLLW